LRACAWLKNDNCASGIGTRRRKRHCRTDRTGINSSNRTVRASKRTTCSTRAWWLDNDSPTTICTRWGKCQSTWSRAIRSSAGKCCVRTSKDVALTARWCNHNDCPSATSTRRERESGWPVPSSSSVCDSCVWPGKGTALTADRIDHNNGSGRVLA
jgi:hypothetical protein